MNAGMSRISLMVLGGMFAASVWAWPAGTAAKQKNKYELPPASDEVRQEAALAKARLGNTVTIRQLVGHRGDSEAAPENTLPAFKAALDKGFNMETDLYMTKDKVVFLTHDQRINRKDCGLPPWTWATNTTWKGQLDAADAGAWKGPQWKGTPYPRLDELFELARDGQFIILEIKDPRKDEILSLVTEAILRHPNVNLGNVFLQGANAKFLKEMPGYRNIGCGLPRNGWSVEDPPRDLMASARRMDPKITAVWSIRWDEELITKALIDQVHARGVKVCVWTVNDAGSAWAALGRGVDWVCTDRPASLWREMQSF